MSFGFEVFNPDGSRRLGGQDRVGSYWGYVTTTIQYMGQTEFIAVPGMTLDGTWFHYTMPWNFDGILWKLGNTYIQQNGGFLVINRVVDNFPMNAVAYYPYRIYVFRG